MKYLIILALLSISIHSTSQTVLTERTTYQWERYNIEGNSELRLSATEIVLPVSYSKGGAIVMREPRLEFGVVKLNGKGGLMWEQRIKGFLVGIAKLGANILVVTTNQEVDRDIVKEVKGAILNASTGKVIKENVLFTNSVKAFMEVKVYNNSAGNVLNISSRLTKWSGGLSTKWGEAEKRNGKI